MKRLVLLTVCVAGLVGQVGQVGLVGLAAAPQQPSRDRARAATGSAVIRGTVFAADTGAPLRRARVNWLPETQQLSLTGGQPQRVMTDDNGRYEIRDLPAGRYRLVAKRTGYLQMDFGARRGQSDGRLAIGAERGVTIELADGQTFTADFQLPRAGAITGRILDEYGDPVIGSFVGAARRQTTNGRMRLTMVSSDMTDDQGEYRLSGLPPASYYVIATAPGYMLMGGGVTYADLFFPGVPSREQAQTVPIREGEEATDITFMLAPARLARISGTVVTSRGTAPRATTFVLTRTSSTGNAIPTAYSIPVTDGNFTLSSVAPGDCDLIVTAEVAPGVTEVGVAHFMVTGDDITGLLIATGSLGQLTGTVRTETSAPLPTSSSGGAATAIGRPTTSMSVAANSVDTGGSGVMGGLNTGNATRSGSVSADGLFAASVQPGPRLIGLSGLASGWGVVSVTSGDRNLTDVPVDIQPGTSLAVQIVISNRLAEINGNAVDAAGNRTWDYEVVLFPQDRSKWLPASPLIRTERPNQRGTFRLTGLRPGDYFVAAVQAGDETDYTDPDVLDRLRAVAVPVTVGLGEAKTLRLQVVSRQ